MAIIESRDFTLEELFGYFYVVRAYQREYVWEEKHVNDLLNDVYIQFDENKSGKELINLKIYLVNGQQNYVKLKIKHLLKNLS